MSSTRSSCRSPEHLAGLSQALLDCQSGPLAANIFMLFPVSHELIRGSSQFRVLLLRRLRLPLPLMRARFGRQQRDCPCTFGANVPPLWNGFQFAIDTIVVSSLTPAGRQTAPGPMHRCSLALRFPCTQNWSFLDVRQTPPTSAKPLPRWTALLAATATRFFANSLLTLPAPASTNLCDILTSYTDGGPFPSRLPSAGGIKQA